MKKLLVLLLLVIGCGTYTKQPVASHVVAVTMEGDTILVAIDKIRPNQYINFYPVYSRPYYQPYYNPYYGNQYRFRYPDNRGISNSVGTRSSNEIKVPPQKEEELRIAQVQINQFQELTMLSLLIEVKINYLK